MEKTKKTFGILSSIKTKKVDGGPAIHQPTSNNNNYKPPTLEQLAGIAWEGNSSSNNSANDAVSTTVAATSSQEETKQQQQRQKSSTDERRKHKKKKKENKKKKKEVKKRRSLEPLSTSMRDNEIHDTPRVASTGVLPIPEVVVIDPFEEELKTIRPRRIQPLQQDLPMRVEELQHQTMQAELRQQKQQPQQSHQSTSKQHPRHPQAQRQISHHEMAPQLFHHSDTRLVTPSGDPPLMDSLNDSESKLMRKKRHSKRRSKSFNERADSPMTMAPNIMAPNRPVDDHMLQVTNKLRSNNLHIHPVASSRESSTSSGIYNTNRESFCRSPRQVQGFATDPSAAKQQQQVQAKQTNKRQPSQHNASKQLEPSKLFNNENNDPPEGGEEDEGSKKDRLKSSNNLHNPSFDNNESHPNTSSNNERKTTTNNDPPEEVWEDMSIEALASSFSSLESTSSPKHQSSQNKSLGSLHMSSFNSKEHANSVDDDDSSGPMKQQSINANTSIATIDPDSSSDDAINTTQKSQHTAGQLYDLIEIMQLEIQKLRSAEVSAEMKTQTLETDLVSMQQERDAEFVSLSEEMEKWKRCAQEKNIQYESIQRKVEWLEDENIRMKMEWSKERLLSSVLLKGKSGELEEKVQILENENRRLRKRLLLKQSSHREQHSRGNRSITALEDTSSHEDESIISFLSAATMTTTSSKIGSPIPISGTVFDTMAVASTSHSLDHPQSLHVRQCYNDYTSDLRPSSNNTTPQAPVSWHGGGNKKKKSIWRLPVIAPPLTSGGMMETNTNTANTATSAAKIHLRMPHIRRNSSSHSNSTAMTSTTARSSTTTLQDLSLSASILREDEEFGSSFQSLDGMVELMEDHNMREDGAAGEDDGIDERTRSSPF